MTNESESSSEAHKLIDFIIKSNLITTDDNIIVWNESSPDQLDAYLYEMFGSVIKQKTDTIYKVIDSSNFNAEQIDSLNAELTASRKRVEELEECLHELVNLVYPYRNKNRNYKDMWEALDAVKEAK